MAQPGLGQIYNGQAKKGVAFFLAQLSFWLILPLLLKYPSALLFAIFLSGLIVCYIYIVLDAILNARNIGDSYSLKAYNRTFVYIGTFVAVSLISNVDAYLVKTYMVQAYKIPAASMEPTLLIGDHILIDKLGSSAKNPVRGDIIVFEYSGDPQKEFIKRVVGVGGDTVEIRDKELYVNNVLVKNDYAIHTDAKIFPKGEERRDNYGPVTVPSNSFFVLGDNRDRSFDSRYWGFVEKSKIRGIAKCIYWSWDSKSRSVRWQRIGQRVS
ncbi:MAG: signal peptidase I [Deltaproteobacteria bacterium]|nr:signal peptidase I [Deltaproteobacteria bacterium]